MQIGELAEKTGAPPSTLRYYEREGILAPSGRTEAGYRTYDEEALRRVKLIRTAQNLGLQLSEIRALLDAGRYGAPKLKAIAERRFIEIEKESARLAVQRHELRSLIIDLEQSGEGVATEILPRLSSHVCNDETGRTHLGGGFRWLADRLDCALASDEATALLDVLKGGHYHVWKYTDGYRVLAVRPSKDALEALRTLVKLESDCAVHPPPKLEDHPDGTVMVVTGEAAFLYASLFVYLDQAESDTGP